MHLEEGLKERDALTLREAIAGDGLRSLEPEVPIFFNPMGMAAFDIAVAARYWREAVRRDIGIRLEA